MTAADERTSGRRRAGRRRPWHGIVIGLIGVVPVVVLVALRVIVQDDRLEYTLGKMLFWTMPFVLGFVAVCALRRALAVERPVLALRRAWPAALVAVLATAVVFAVEPPELRVQFDETSLVGVSQSMFRDASATMTTGAVPFGGEVMALESTVDKRPPLFAFLVQLVHHVAGYRVGNAFAVNAGLLALGLFAASAAARARAGPFAGVAAPVLLLAVPLTVVTATSAGFDTMATVWFLLAVLAAQDFVARPDDARLAGLTAAGMLFAQARYESLPATVLLGGLVCWLVRGRFRPSWSSWTLLALCPALVLPLGFLLLHAQNPKFYPEAGGQPLLALSHLVEHAGPFAAAWFDPRPANPLPGVVAWAALVAVAARLARRRARVADALAAVPVVAVTVLALAWFYGDVREQTALRLFLPCAWLTALAPLAAWPMVSGRWRVVALALLVALAGWRVALVARGASFPPLRIAQLTRELDRLVERLPVDQATTLWVGAPAQHLIVGGHAALTVAAFERRRADVVALRRGGHVRAIYVVETPIDDLMAPALGSPRELLRELPSEVVERVSGAMPITVHRLAR